MGGRDGRFLKKFEKNKKKLTGKLNKMNGSTLVRGRKDFVEADEEDELTDFLVTLGAKKFRHIDQPHLFTLSCRRPGWIKS